MAPTKHNVLCRGRSVREVILSHDDFSSRPSTLVKRSEDETEADEIDQEVETEGPQTLQSVPESGIPGLFNKESQPSVSLNPFLNSKNLYFVALNLKVVRQPSPKYVLILESSSSMMEQVTFKNRIDFTLKVKEIP